MDSAALLTQTIDTVIALVPAMLAALFAFMAYETWVEYKSETFAAKQKYSLLEIRIPKEVNKSPLAMELFLSSLHITGGDSNTWWDKLTSGKSRPRFSLEIVSIGGDVSFFIWTRSGLRKFIESQLYAQYPGIEVREVPDYTSDIEFNPSEMNLWGFDIALNKSDVYPIKTYVDFGLDKDPKEEFKVDPITPVLEFLGSLQKGENVWIQFIVRAHKPDLKKVGESKLLDRWKEEAKEEIEKIREKTLSKTEDDKGGKPNPTKGQIEVINAIERNVSKLGFDCSGRAIYFANKDVFDGANISGLTSVFKQYSSEGLNGFKPIAVPGFDFPWQDFKGKKLIKLKQKKLNAYKERSPYNSSKGMGLKIIKDEGPAYQFVFSTESLATVYHYPGNVAQTPTFARVLSKKGEPPANLPI